MKKILSVTLLACSLLSVLPVLEAAIPIHAIANTSSIMKTGLPWSFSDAIIALRQGLITSLRTMNPDIIYVSPGAGKHPCHAGNEAIEPVADLLIKLFPSQGGTLNITRGHSQNLSTFMSEWPSKQTQYEIIAELLIACREIRANKPYNAGTVIEGLKTQGPHDTETKNREFRKCITAALEPIFTAVAKSAEFEKTTFLYSENTTELLLMAWCCEFFSDKDDVVGLLKTFNKKGLISDFDETLLGPDKLPDYMQDILTRINAERNITSEELLAVSPINVIAPYALGEDFDQSRRITTKRGRTQDCVETTIRHLTTILSKYNSSTGIITPPDKFHPAARAFFATYDRGETANRSTREIHQDWYQVISANSDDADSDEQGMLASWYTLIKCINQITKSNLALDRPAGGMDYTNEQAAQKLEELAQSGTIRDDVTFSFEGNKDDKTLINCMATKKDTPTENYYFVISVNSEHSCLKPVYTVPFKHYELIRRDTDIDKFYADRGLYKKADVQPSISSLLAYEKLYHLTEKNCAATLLEEQVTNVGKQESFDPRTIAGIELIVDSILKNGKQKISSGSTVPAFSEGLEIINKQYPELYKKIQKIVTDE